MDVVGVDCPVPSTGYLKPPPVESHRWIELLTTKQKKVMLGPTGGLSMGGKEEYSVPPWLKPLLKTSFFVPCELHSGASKNECNMYCLGCTGDALCSYCLPHHRGHHIVQLGAMNYDPCLTFAVQAKPAGRERHNGSESDESSSPKCPIRRTPSSSAAAAFGRWIDVDISINAPSTEGGGGRGSKKQQQRSPAVGEDEASHISPGTPPIVSYRTSRRKGIPHRSPF